MKHFEDLEDCYCSGEASPAFQPSLLLFEDHNLNAEVDLYYALLDPNDNSLEMPSQPHLSSTQSLELAPFPAEEQQHSIKLSPII